MVRAFYEQNCAMVVGTYMMTDFNMNMIAPGIIDHKEWTPANGRNNALRINGLGAPRAFYTPVLREVKVPQYQLWRRLCTGTELLPPVPDRTRVRRGLPLPPLGRQLRCLTGHRENERTQPLQRPHPYLGTSGTHSDEQKQVI